MELLWFEKAGVIGQLVLPGLQRLLGRQAFVSTRVNTVESLAAVVRWRSAVARAIVLLPADREELGHCLTLAPLLDGAKVCLGLPDNQPASRKEAHLLRPRYLAVPPLDSAELMMILHRLLTHGNHHDGVMDHQPPAAGQLVRHTDEPTL